MKTLLIDGNNLVAIASFVKMEELTTPDGFPTGGIMGFLRIVRNILDDLEPDKVVVAWDGGRSRWRCSCFPDYKAQRASARTTPEDQKAYEDYLTQMRVVQDDLSPLLGLANVRIRGYEGDDLLAFMSREVAESVDDSIATIVSTDKDALQLVSPKVWVYSPIKKLMIRPQNFKAVTGLKVGQYLEYRMLIGDKSDNIPGIPGIGEKTAKSILSEYETLDRFFVEAPNGPKIGWRQKALLSDPNSRGLLEINRKLMDLGNVPYDGTPMEVWGPSWDQKGVLKFCRELRFQQIIASQASFFGPFVRLNSNGSRP